MNNLANLSYLTASMTPFAIMVLAFCIGTYVIAIGSMGFYVHHKKSGKRLLSRERTAKLLHAITRKRDAKESGEAAQSQRSESHRAESIVESFYNPPPESVRSDPPQSIISARSGASNAEPQDEEHGIRQSIKSSNSAAEKGSKAMAESVTSNISSQNKSRTSLSGLSQVLRRRSGEDEKDADENV